jgi:hypothetical protein
MEDSVPLLTVCSECGEISKANELKKVGQQVAKSQGFIFEKAYEAGLIVPGQGNRSE